MQNFLCLGYKLRVLLAVSANFPDNPRMLIFLFHWIPNVTKHSIMVKPITRDWLIYDFMVAAFVRITHFLRYISEFTRASKSLKHLIYILSGCKTQYQLCLVQS